MPAKKDDAPAFTPPSPEAADFAALIEALHNVGGAVGAAIAAAGLRDKFLAPEAAPES